MAKIVLLLVVMVAVWGFSSCSGLSICNLSTQGLKACQPAAVHDNPAAPSPVCCAAINALTANDIQCLCDFKKNNPAMMQYAGVDPDQAMKLPGLCGSKTPVNCA